MRQKERRRFSLLVLWILLVLSVLVVYGIYVEPYRVNVHHVWIRDDSLGRILEKEVIVQLSDLHIGKIGRRERTVLKILDVLKPDIIFLTGDYVQWKGDYVPALTFLSLLKSNIGIWAVMGDYDYSRSRMSCLFCHEKGSGEPSLLRTVRFLRDTTEPVTLKSGTFWIAGVDFENTSSVLFEKSLFPLIKKKPLIILSHNPLFFDRIDSGQSVLMLAGDTHGGQIPLPSWLLLALGYKKNAFYNQGLFVMGQKKMFVSRGIGTSHFPMRVFRQPEVAVLHFRP